MALVIGNNNYPAAPLVNSIRDAETMKSSLEQSGFTVQLAVNTNLRDLDQTIARFLGSLHPGDIVLVFYSGHGVQLQEQNYLLPVDFKAENAVDAKYAAYPVSRLLENLEAQGIGLKIIILDACRNNPFGRGWRSQASRGLVPMTAGRGTYLAFATAPGGVASDNPAGRNGLFTEELARTIAQPGLTIDQVFNRVRGRVRERSGNAQVPWSTSSIEGEFYFRQPAVAPPRASDTDIELEFWRSVQSLGSPTAYAEYLRQYPNGKFAALARIRSATPPSPAPAPPPAVSLGAIKVNPKDGLKYVWIPPGEFTIGCSPGDTACWDDEKPAHRVTIERGFWIGQTEVTQRAYYRLMNSNPSRFTGGTLPVERVTVADARAYCKVAALDLPTEAQWEYAARAGVAQARYGPIETTAWYSGNSAATTHTVGSKIPNAWGLYDMLGNVSELVAEKFSLYGTLRVTDQNAPGTVRGGAWKYGESLARLSTRSSQLGASDATGFRCAGDLP